MKPHLTRKNVIMGAAIFVVMASFVVSLLMLSLSPHARERRVIFFYNDVARKYLGDVQSLKKRSTIEQSVTDVLAFLVARPENAEWRTLLNGGAIVNTVQSSGSTVYVDLTVDVNAIAAKGEDMRTDLAIIRKTIKFNFPSIKTLKITINGNEPYSSPV